MECSYKNNKNEIIPSCGGPVEYVERGYFRGPGIKKNGGPDMWLCKIHAEFLQTVNPFSHRIEHQKPKK